MSDQPNPYRPPVTVNETPLPVQETSNAPSRLLRVSVAIQSLGLLIGIIFEAMEHENIVGIGPLLTLAGTIVAVIAWRERYPAGIWFGGSAVAFCLFVVLLINLYGWGPRQGDLPITMLTYLYTFVIAPIAYRILFAPRLIRADS